MTLSDLASIGSLVSGIAVLVSLIYVAVQIRQTERNQRTLLQQGTSARTVEVLKHWSDPLVASAFIKTQNGDTDLTAMDAFQLSLQLRISLTSFQDNFLLNRASLIDDLQLESSTRTLKVLLSQPVLRAVWEISRDAFSPEFVEWVDAHTKNIPLVEPRDPAQRLKVAIADVKAAAR